MAFVRAKRVGGTNYYQLVQAQRIDGKPRQRVLLHLGLHRTVNDALKSWPREIRSLRRKGNEEAAEALAEKLKRLREFCENGVA